MVTPGRSAGILKVGISRLELGPSWVLVLRNALEIS